MLFGKSQIKANQWLVTCRLAVEVHSMTLVTHMRGGDRCGSEGESRVVNEGLPPPPLHETQQC